MIAGRIFAAVVSLTRQAADNIRAKKGEKRYIRVCLKEEESGRSFCVDFTDDVNRDDILYMSYGIKILVDGITRRHFEDLKVDFFRNNGHGDFVFNMDEVPVPEIS